MCPLCPLFPGTVLALVTLLTLQAAAGGARADSAPTATRSSLPESKERLEARGVPQRSCGRNLPSPMITATTAGERGYRFNYNNEEHLDSTYGDDITILCSSKDASNLSIRDDNHQLQAQRLNSTTVQVTIIKPDVRRYSYHCTDSITTCTVALRVGVLPDMSVTAPHVRQGRADYGFTIYFVPRGESYNVYCSGYRTSDLILTTSGHIRINSVNSTTLMATVSDHTEGERNYCCFSSNSLKMTNARIAVDYYPEAREFRCVFNRLVNVECWWNPVSKGNIFKLFILSDQESTLICLDNSRVLTAGCAGTVGNDLYLQHYFFVSNPTILFQLETCNTVFCSNQTFRIDLLSITKLDPVDDLKVVRTSPLDATVAWRQDSDPKSCTYKFEYRLLGRDWRPVNASTVRCEDYGFTCELQLALPCPGAHYELRVYLRNKQATLDMYWSEPATIFYFTAPSTEGEVDPACAADFREPEPTPSARIGALHDVRELISDERKDEQALNKRISDLYTRVAQIKALMDSQKQRNP